MSSVIIRTRTATASILLSFAALIACPQSPDLSIVSPARAQEQPQADPLLEEFKAVVGLYETGKYQEAIDRGTALAEKVKARDGENIGLAFVLNHVALAHAALGHGPQADELYKRVLAIREQVRGKNHPEVAQTLNNLGELYRTNGRFKEASEYYTRAIAIVENVSEAQALLAIILNNLAITNQALGLNPQADELFRRALKIYEQVFGPDNPNVAVTLNNIAEMYRGLARYAEAEPLYKRAAEIIEKAAGPEHPTLALVIGNLALVYYHVGKYAEAEPLQKRAISIREKVLGPNHPDLGLSLNNLAEVYRLLARYSEAEPLYKRAIDITEKGLGPQHPLLAVMVGNLALVHFQLGRNAEAEPLFRRAIEIREKILGPNHPDVGLALTNLAALYIGTGRYSEAEALNKRALPILERGLGENHPLVANVLGSLGVISTTVGRNAEAEAFHRRALVIREKALGAEHSDVALSLIAIAEIYTGNRRHAEAEPVLKRALAIIEKALGPNHPNLAYTLTSLGLIYQATGRDAEAEALYRRAIEIRESALGREHPDLAVSFNNLADLFLKAKRNEEAEALFRRAVEIWEKVDKDYPPLFLPLRNIAFMYLNQNRLAEADALYARTLALQEKTLGTNHIELAETLTQYALLKRSRYQIDEAVEMTQRSVRLVIDTLTKNSSATGLDASQLPGHFAFHLDILWRARLEGKLGRDAAVSTFEAAQWGNQSEAATALGQMAVRLGAGNDALAALIRDQQDISAFLRVLDKDLVAEFSKPAAERNRVREDEIRNRMVELERKLKEYNTRIAAEFPRYAELVGTQPLSVSEVQKLLGPDEVVLLYHVNPNRSFVWAVTRERIAWEPVKLSGRFFNSQVESLRAALDIEQNKDLSKPFDYEAAHRLYSAVLGPVEDIIKSKPHLIVVPAGPLASLPFHVLVTEKKTGRADDHRSAAWLVRKHAVTVLPAVASLKALREVATRAAAPQPYLGFGDPTFKAPPGQAAAPPRARLAAVSRGVSTRMDDLRRALVPLPDTADELRAVARALNVPPTQVKLAKDATEAAVKTMRLSDYRILHFATHGLIASQTARFNDRNEPSLALTLPPLPSEQDDGLLTASEVAALNLNAEWVILSACNTAAGAKPGAEPLSGLARSFFYAGAKTLLVSHWPVESDAAVRLVTGAIRTLERDRNLTPAEALRRAMVALLDDRSKAQGAHPGIWAPFVIVGTTARAK